MKPNWVPILVVQDKHRGQSLWQIVSNSTQKTFILSLAGWHYREPVVVGGRAMQ